MTSTSTLLVGTTICSCSVGMGGFLYWRRAFWICCLTSSRAASSVGVWVVIFGKSGTWAVQPSGDKVQSTGYGWFSTETLYCISKRYACKTHLLPRRCQINPIPIQIRIFPKVNRRLIHAVHKSEKILKSNPKPQSESVVIHPKIMTRKSESVLIHSLQHSAKNYNRITKITIRRFHGTLYWIQNSFTRGRKTVCVQN